MAVYGLNIKRWISLRRPCGAPRSPYLSFNNSDSKFVRAKVQNANMEVIGWPSQSQALEMLMQSVILGQEETVLTATGVNSGTEFLCVRKSSIAKCGIAR